MAYYNYFYLPYKENTNINYIYLLYLYCIAQSNKDEPFDIIRKNERIKNEIEFTSFKDLEQQINTKLSKFQKKDNNGNSKTLVSDSTLSRIVKDDEYKFFLSFYKFGKNKSILLNNDFHGKTNKPFVRLSPTMVNLLLEQKDNLLAQYIIYIVHYCGISNNKTDFTALQFLGATGYSLKANNYLSKISEYNKLLESNGIISIHRWRDEEGKLRNTYSLINYYTPAPKIVLQDQPAGISQQDEFVF